MKTRKGQNKVDVNENIDSCWLLTRTWRRILTPSYLVWPQQVTHDRLLPGWTGGCDDVSVRCTCCYYVGWEKLNQTFKYFICCSHWNYWIDPERSRCSRTYRNHCAAILLLIIFFNILEITIVWKRWYQKIRVVVMTDSSVKKIARIERYTGFWWMNKSKNERT